MINVPLGSVQVVLAGLASPRGVAVGTLKAYVAGKMAQIYEIDLAQKTKEAVLKLSTMSRLDGLSLEGEYLYWTESNTNVVARASINRWRRSILIGHQADQRLRWPRSVLVADGVLYFTEYAGRIVSGSIADGPFAVLLSDSSTSDSMERLDDTIQVCSASGTTAFITMD